MKKTLIASAIALTAIGSTAAQADIAISNMVFGGTYAAGGTLNAAGTGSMYSIDPFFGHTWTASQQTGFMSAGDVWAGTSLQGAYNYNTDLAGMTAGQAAVGLFFNWNGSNEIAVLEIFDCVGGICAGNGVAMANGPFAGSVATFNGTGDAGTGTGDVPVPAAAWLMGSGLLGLVGVARRRKA